MASSSAPSPAQEIPLDLIDEDPNQPRKKDNPGFTRKSLQELADTISVSGVKSPISLRIHPEKADRYMINHGARRFRASKIAGKTTIPAFLDKTFTELDQAIENLQREDMTPMEIAVLLQKELQRGTKRIHIAKKIGKSPAYITQHLGLLDLPPAVKIAWDKGKVKNVSLVSDLARAYRTDPTRTTAWIEDSPEITMNGLRSLRKYLKYVHQNVDPVKNPEKASEEKQQNRRPSIKWQIWVDYRGQKAVLLYREPSAAGRGWLRVEGEIRAREVDLSECCCQRVLKVDQNQIISSD
ncbi:ParB/RepB/Spo0J family partition protein [Desulforhopalus vacuolatus]|uniref:ParB/RepB/Spo0J family partition protein n=1 Tax=Desulforhopalus vacuolatus TaxID=40414 RepID=UPI001962FCF4|nr:ParB/RepB/Spo0J family partition protein [Desulforhopalus vacuolatus]MBM9519138.1 ParB/RepB/Spo0J family partition protein [Desulforhopalus vacuolatus]